MWYYRIASLAFIVVSVLCVVISPDTPGNTVASFPVVMWIGFLTVVAMAGIAAGFGGLIASFGLRETENKHFVTRPNLIGRNMCFPPEKRDGFGLISLKTGVGLLAAVFLFVLVSPPYFVYVLKRRVKEYFALNTRYG